MNSPFCLSARLQKYKEYLNGSNLIVKLQAKHDLLKQTLGEGTTDMQMISAVKYTPGADNLR